MDKDKNMLPLENETLDAVMGGVAAPGSVMICTADAPLYAGNPAGNFYRSTSQVEDMVRAGTQVKLFEYGPRYCRVIANGKTGWVETAFLAGK